MTPSANSEPSPGDSEQPISKTNQRQLTPLLFSLNRGRSLASSGSCPFSGKCISQDLLLQAPKVGHLFEKFQRTSGASILNAKLAPRTKPKILHPVRCKI